MALAGFYVWGVRSGGLGGVLCVCMWGGGGYRVQLPWRGFRGGGGGQVRTNPPTPAVYAHMVMWLPEGARSQPPPPPTPTPSHIPPPAAAVCAHDCTKGHAAALLPSSPPLAPSTTCSSSVRPYGWPKVHVGSPPWKSQGSVRRPTLMDAEGPDPSRGISTRQGTLSGGGSGSGFRVQGSGFRVQGSGFRVQGSGSGFRVQGSGLRVQGSRFRVQGSGFRFRVQGSGFKVQGSGFRDLGGRFRV